MNKLLHLQKKRVLVTGACGTIGQELTRQILLYSDVLELIGLDNNESELFFMEQRYHSTGKARFLLCDMRDYNALQSSMQHVDIVFHAAALKHVILCERSPFEAVQTNILGVRNIIAAAHASGVERVIFTSSDKAVNPTSVMGTSKLMGERLVTSANSNAFEGTIFASTRFGNVMGSRGSVIPIFRQQIKNGGPVTLTAPEMTRFIMSIDEAVRLVLDSAAIARGGEVFVTKMPVIRIADLAEVMIKELAPKYGHDPEKIKINIIGSKPGEKLYEELMSGEETRRSLELERYFVITPAYPSLYRPVEYKYAGLVSSVVTNPYHSGKEAILSQEELKDFLLKNKLLDEFESGEHPAERHWP